MSLKCQKCSGWRQQSEGGEESGKDDRLAPREYAMSRLGRKRLTSQPMFRKQDKKKSS